MKSKVWKDLAEKIAQAFPEPSHELLPIPTLEQALAEHVTTTELAQLKPHLWRATMANYVYQNFRIPAIHGFGPSEGIVLELSQLASCARGLIAEARRRSEDNGQWFGNDAIVFEISL